jgi:hypothetical protein
MEKYNHRTRMHSFHWNCIQIENFITNAAENKSTSYITYAALECRIAIERIEYELLAIGTRKYLPEEWFNLITNYKGIDRANKKYKSLKFKVQTFTEAFASVFTEYPLKAFDFKKASNYESKLADYIHLYYRSNDDLNFDSEFMQNGIFLIKDVLNFLNNLFVKFEDSFIFGVVDIRTLMNGAEYVFQKWLNDKSTDFEIVKQELIELKKQSKGKDIVAVEKCTL